MEALLRPVNDDDQEFLLKLYASTRREEVACWGWPPEQQDAFLRMQFTAQKRSYEVAYGDADHQVVIVQGQAIGRIIVLRTEKEMRLVDIALIPEFRGLKIGSELICGILEEAEMAGKVVRLQVAKGNPARRLYERLGFSLIDEDQLYCQMEWVPATGRSIEEEEVEGEIG
jgi:ribosomal protein S18 acetylase RimI-like enzyme